MVPGKTVYRETALHEFDKLSELLKKNWVFWKFRKNLVIIQPRILVSPNFFNPIQNLVSMRSALLEAAYLKAVYLEAAYLKTAYLEALLYWKLNAIRLQNLFQLIVTDKTNFSATILLSVGWFVSLLCSLYFSPRSISLCFYFVLVWK